VAGAPDPALLDSVCREVERNFEETQIPLFRRLVEQPSCTREPEDVEAAARLLDEQASALGLERQLRPDPERRYADHRIFTSPAAARGQDALALVGHIDTVFPRDMGFFGFRRDGDTVRGPGVLDMKGGLTVVVHALTALKRVSPETYAALPFRFVCNTDEEVGSQDSHRVFEEIAPHTREALVFEGGREDDRIITRRKGGAVFRIDVYGKAAHAGNRHAEGVSAVHALALLIARLEEMTDYDRGVTVNVGRVQGGTAKNTVPEHAWCEIDGRFEQAADGEALAKGIEQWVQHPDLPPRLGSARIERSGGITRPPLVPSDASQALRTRYETHAAAVGLGTGEADLQGGGSDANILSGLGIPSIDGLGPRGRHFHSTEEWSSLASLLRRTQALARLVVESGLSD
jgi:glutamate carboxypeptidase